MGTIWVFVPKTRTLFSDFLKQCCTTLPFSSCDQNLWKTSAKESVFNKVSTFNFIYRTSYNFTLTLAFLPKLVVTSLSVLLSNKCCRSQNKKSCGSSYWEVFQRTGARKYRKKYLKSF